MTVGPTEYLAVMSGTADEELRRDFVRRLQERDPDLMGLLDQHRSRAIRMFREMPGEISDRKAAARLADR